MRNVIGLFFIAILFTGCLPKQKVLTSPSARDRVNVPQSKRISSKPSGTISVSATTYIEQYKEIAIQEMNQFGIPASIKLAQALLESGNGNSRLAREANNHFGIKCASWTGKRVYKDDDAIDDCFRSYSRVEESFRDHSQFLLRKRYAALFELDKNDYIGWAKGLKAAGYATNPRYAELLINLIERYQLYQYDSSETRVEKHKREEKVFTEIVHNAPNEVNTEEAKPPVTLAVHEVRAGETVFSISQKYGLKIEVLRKLNNIKGDRLSVGQLLMVSN